MYRWMSKGCCGDCECIVDVIVGIGSDMAICVLWQVQSRAEVE